MRKPGRRLGTGPRRRRPRAACTDAGGVGLAVSAAVARLLCRRGKAARSQGERLGCKPLNLDSEEQVLGRAVSAAAAVKRVRDTGPEPRARTSVPVELLFY